MSHNNNNKPLNGVSIKLTEEEISTLFKSLDANNVCTPLTCLTKIRTASLTDERLKRAWPNSILSSTKKVGKKPSRGLMV